ncbi:MAG: hypothetical protein KJ063_00715 [Anaerolineae bacterium]|nr:hypothetical protein [Anaerolineae bacterium]
MDEFTLLIIIVALLIVALLGLAVLLWPSRQVDDVPRYTTSSKNGRGYWE